MKKVIPADWARVILDPSRCTRGAVRKAYLSGGNGMQVWGAPRRRRSRRSPHPPGCKPQVHDALNAAGTR